MGFEEDQSSRTGRVKHFQNNGREQRAEKSTPEDSPGKVSTDFLVGEENTADGCAKSCASVSLVSAGWISCPKIQEHTNTQPSCACYTQHLSHLASIVAVLRKPVRHKIARTSGYMYKRTFFAQAHPRSHSKDRTKALHEQYLEVQEIWYDEAGQDGLDLWYT
jgi:hypothetical protein